MPERLLTRARLERATRYNGPVSFDATGRPILPWDGVSNSYEVSDVDDEDDELRARIRAAVSGPGGHD